MKNKLFALSLMLLPLCAAAQNAIGDVIQKFVTSKVARKCIILESHENNQKGKLPAYMDITDYRFTKKQSKCVDELIRAVRDHRLEAYDYKELLPGFDDNHKENVWIDRGAASDNNEQELLTVGADNKASYILAYVRSREDEKYRNAYVLRWKVNGTTQNYMTLRVVSIFGRDPKKMVRTSNDFMDEFSKLLSVVSTADTQNNSTAFARSALNRIYELCDAHVNLIRTLSSNQRHACCEGIKELRNSVKAVKNDKYNGKMVEAIDHYVWSGRP